MPLPHEKSPARPSLEDLLRLKRRERPSPEFWGEFERGLREKQLAALVRQPRGWARVRPLLFRAMRWTVPATAAAVATFGVFRHVMVNPGVAENPPTAPVAMSPAHSEATTNVAFRESPAQSKAEVALLSSTSIDSDFAQPTAVVARGDSPAVTQAVGLPSIPIREVASYVSLKPANLTRPASTSGLRFSNSAELGVNDGFVPVSFAGNSGLPEAVVQPAVMPVNSANGPVGSWNDFDGRAMLVSALDLRVTADHAASLPSTPVNHPLQPRSKVRLSDDEERDIRDLGSRFDVQGSSLTIRF